MIRHRSPVSGFGCIRPCNDILDVVKPPLPKMSNLITDMHDPIRASLEIGRTDHVMRIRFIPQKRCDLLRVHSPCCPPQKRAVNPPAEQRCSYRQDAFKRTGQRTRDQGMKPSAARTVPLPQMPRVLYGPHITHQGVTILNQRSNGS